MENSLLHTDSVIVSMLEACYVGNLELIQFLCRSGRSDELFVDSHVGVTPFLVLCEKMEKSERHSYVVEYVLSEIQIPVQAIHHFATYNYHNLKSDYTPLHFFVHANNLSLVKHFCKKYGAYKDIIVSSLSGMSPILTATKLGNIEMLKFFFSELVSRFLHVNSAQYFIDFQYPSNCYSSAIFVACDLGNLEMATYLIKTCKCSLAMVDTCGRTPLMIAISRFIYSSCSYFSKIECLSSQRNRLNIVDLLLKSGSLFNILDLQDHRLTHHHPVIIAFDYDSISLLECVFPYFEVSIRAQISWFISSYLTYMRGFKVFRWIARKLFVSDDERTFFFSLLIREFKYELNDSIEFFDFIIFGVFDSHPRLLFDKYFKENDVFLCLRVKNILRFVELGWFHDTSGKVLHHRTNAVFNCVEMIEFQKLIFAQISFLVILQKLLKFLPEAVS
jgi:hypothetical protein